MMCLRLIYFSIRYVASKRSILVPNLLDSNGKSLFDSVWFGALNSSHTVIATFLNVVFWLLVVLFGDF